MMGIGDWGLGIGAQSPIPIREFKIQNLFFNILINIYELIF